MLLEWVEGVEQWQQWHDLSSSDCIALLDELAVHHANFAKPLPFKGIGSIYFNSLPADTQNIYLATDYSNLALLFLARTLAARNDHPSSSIQETITLGQFLDAAQALLAIKKHPLLLDVQAKLYKLLSTPADHAFRNIKTDPETHKTTTLLDWMIQYSKNICWYDGSGEWSYETGAFMFMPLDEVGKIVEDMVPEPELVAEEEESEVADNGTSGSEVNMPEDSEEENSGGDEASKLDNIELLDVAIDEHDMEDYDHPCQIKDTRL
ncbi:hypothetical protein BDQ17DRAFT_1335694 [Cyathus striatus]|nr:hypothetical protein BDQ17DRAFT_1335694 [Cyathus striatus]